MKRLLIISAVILVLVGACTMTLLYNKKKIDEKANVDIHIQRIPVFAVAVQMKSLDGDFSAQGTFFPVHELTVLTEGLGSVQEVRFETGDFVQAGQLLARLDDDLIRSQLSLAEASLEKSSNDLKKYEELLKSDAISIQQVEDARLGVQKMRTDVISLGKQLKHASITAPIQGTITKKYIEIGSVLMPGTPVADIVDISRLKFIAHISESEVVDLKRGSKVKITSTLFPGLNYTGTILSVGVKADDAKRFPVEIEVTNKADHALKAGMFGTVFFTGQRAHEVMVIPRHAIVGSIKEPRVYVVDGDRAVLKEIRIGAANDKELEVTEGLLQGDQVITSGQINLADQARIRIVNNQ